MKFGICATVDFYMRDNSNKDVWFASIECPSVITINSLGNAVLYSGNANAMLKLQVMLDMINYDYHMHFASRTKTDADGNTHIEDTHNIDSIAFIGSNGTSRVFDRKCSVRINGINPSKEPNALLDTYEEWF